MKPKLLWDGRKLSYEARSIKALGICFQAYYLDLTAVDVTGEQVFYPHNLIIQVIFFLGNMHIMLWASLRVLASSVLVRLQRLHHTGVMF